MPFHKLVLTEIFLSSPIVTLIIKLIQVMAHHYWPYVCSSLNDLAEFSAKTWHDWPWMKGTVAWLVMIESKHDTNGHDWKWTWCNWSWLKANMVWSVGIEHNNGAIGHDWKRTGPYGHKLTSVRVQQSSNGVRWETTNSLLEVKGCWLDWHGYTVW